MVSGKQGEAPPGSVSCCDLSGTGQSQGPALGVRKDLSMSFFSLEAVEQPLVSFSLETSVTVYVVATHGG